MLNKSNSLTSFFLYGTSLFLIAVGSFVIYGWLFKIREAVQVLPNFVPMQFNTALCFLISGVVLILFYNNKKIFANTFSVFVLLISFITLIEYVFSINFGVDELFVKAFISTKTSHPGRMAPNTAICFLFFSVFILMSQIKKLKLWYVFGFIPCILAVLGSISLIGYMLNIEQAYAWGALTHMALHTSVGFIVLSIGSFIIFFNKFYLTSIQKTLIFDATTFSFILFLLFAIWLSVRASIISQIKDDTEEILEILTSKISVKIESEIDAIARIFSRYSLGSYLNYSVLKSDTVSYFKHMPFLVSVNFDATKKTAKTYFISPLYEKTPVYSMNMECEKKSNFSLKADRLIISNSFYNGISILCVQKNMYLAVVNLSEIINLFSSKEVAKYNFSISSVGERNILTIGNFNDDEYLSFWEKEKVIDVYGNKYIIKIVPRKNFIEHSIGRFSFYTLLVGVLFSTLALLVVKNKRQLFKKESALKSSKILNYTLLNSVGESIIGVNTSCKINFMNSSAQDLLRYSFNEKKLVNIGNILKNNINLDKVSIVNLIKKSMKKSKVIRLNRANLVYDNGKDVPVTFSSSPIIEENNTVGAIVVLFDITDQITYEDSLLKMAHFDSLTKLPNRYSIISHIEKSISRAKRENIPFALCFVDINQFKKINDTYGHDVGDKALQFLGGKISGNIRRNDFSGRLSGDEFCLILEGVKNPFEVEYAIEKLKKSLLEPFVLKDIAFTIDVSVGYAIYTNEATAEEILKKADYEMYKYKNDRG